MRIDAQVAAEHEPLPSVTKCANIEFDCLLSKSGGYLMDQITGETIQIRRHGNLCVLKRWVEQAGREGTTVGFHRQESSREE